MKVLLAGIYDTNTISLAPHTILSYVRQFDVSSKFDLLTKEFSIFNNSVDSIIKGIKQEQPDIVGFSVYIWNINEVLKIIKHIDALIILGGPQVTGIEDELLRNNPDIDIIVTGEGEATFKELLEYLDGGKKLDEIAGITTRNTKTQPRDVIENLDCIPSIYRNIFKEYPNLTWISLETSRGCPMGCKYCCWSFSKRMRYFSLERVKRDLDIILNEKNIEFIYFCDSSILLDKERGKQILKYIISSKQRKMIRFEFDVEQLDGEIIDLLQEIPNCELNLGIQTTNRRALSEMGRKRNEQKFENNYLKLTKTANPPNIRVDLIYGLPGDDIQGYKKSLNYAICLDDVSRISTYPLVILPGSDFYREMKKYKIKIKDNKSYIIEENYTFSREEMELARKYSFFVTVIYLNCKLKDCIKSFAKSLRQEPIETIIDFMDRLPFNITQRFGWPYMIPSIREDFEHRNAVFRTVIERYSNIIHLFKLFSKNRFDDMLADYEKHFSPHYHTLKRVIGLD
jgi:radical SAM superfamily enzyme YgiQ (UPF0313 family)